MRKLLIAPSILSADPLAISTSVDMLQNSHDWLHVDIMDGHFVPNLTYGPMLVKALREHYPEMFLDVHLMVTPTENFVDMFIQAKPDLLTVHAESTIHLHRVLSLIRDSGIKPGVVLNPASSLESIKPVLGMVDVVLLMSVNPGFGNQKFIPLVLDKAVELCQIRASKGLDFLIEMDGGVGETTLPDVVKSGVDVAVMGNAVFSTKDPAATVAKMRKIAADCCHGH